MFKPISESLNEMREMERSIVVGAIFRLNPYNIFAIAFWEALWDNMGATNEYRANRQTDLDNVRIKITSIDKIGDNIKSITWVNGKSHHTSNLAMFMESYTSIDNALDNHY